MADVLLLVLCAASFVTGGIVLLSTELSPELRGRVDSSTSTFRLQFFWRYVLTTLALPVLLSALGASVGKYFIAGTRTRYRQVISNTESEERAEQKHQPYDDEWEAKVDAEAARLRDPKVREQEFNGVIGFFHPFCNAGGGGERVLWAAIRATQLRYPKAICVVYTGDHDASKSEILKNVSSKFNIPLKASRIHFLYLSTRSWVLASSWPRLTLLGQSVGSLVLLADAFTLVVPDVFIDTMGYAFVLAAAKWLVPSLPVGAYVHYPTISTDMLESLDHNTDAKSSKEGLQSVGNRGLNAGTGKGLKGQLKRRYWQLFAWLYSWAGGHVDVVMTNSTWTQNHVRQLWQKARQRQGRTSEIEVNFPPCAVEQLEKTIEVSAKSEESRGKVLLYIAQFRPEKNHELILNAFAEMTKRDNKGQLKDARLVLIGSVRDDRDSQFIYKLKLLAHELGVGKKVEWIMNASWTTILDWLQKSSVGVNGMWNEHFGISVVEAQAAGLIGVVNDSGGPKFDIVIDYAGGPTGFHASTAEEYASGFAKALCLSKDEALQMRYRARKSAKRFTEEEFDKKWLIQLGRLIHMEVYPAKEKPKVKQWGMSLIYTLLTGRDMFNIFAPYIEERLGVGR